MRKFYSSCGVALHHAIEKDVTATSMWLSVAKEERDRLRKGALSRLELQTVSHLDEYFSLVVEACMDHWTNGPTTAFYALLMPAILRMIDDNLPADGKTLPDGSSLHHRWEESMPAGV